MCGIAGLIAHPGSNVSLPELGNRMRNSLVHRGPDSHGMWVNDRDRLVFVHNRLAIQDLSEHGHQPMWSPSGRYCIVFNGEIYNFRKLAKELTKMGCEFIGHSDTEVLLNAIEQWGLSEAVQHSIGMFAFAIWDAREQSISLCRDRLGEKPLYYGWHENRFCFASELKAIESIAPRRSLEIDHRGLSRYLRHGYISAPYSIYEGIYKLGPGTIFSLPIKSVFDRSKFSPHADGTAIAPKTYWSALDAANNGLSSLIDSEEEAIEELGSLLRRTVKMQRIADVGVGVFLSGGIDSSTVAAVAQSESTANVKTFSIGFSEPEYDESMHANEIAKYLGTEHSTITVSSNDALKLVPELPSIFDEPFADSSQIPMYIVSKFARERVTVCLSGDGGDELFAGYNRYLSTNSIWNRIGPIPLPFRKALGKALAVPTPEFWDRIYNRLYKVGRSSKEKQKLVGLKLQKLAGLMQQTDLMSAYEYLLSYWHQPQRIMPFGNAVEALDLELPGSSDFINKAMYMDQVGYLEGDNLTKVDRAGMAVSLETRLPLLSHEVVELAWRIPVSMKARRNTSKWILRQVLFELVPPELIERPKMGFSVPVAQWLRGGLRAWAEDMLCLIGTDGYEFLRAKPIQSAWNEHVSGKRDYSQRLWTVLMLLAWRQQRI